MGSLEEERLVQMVHDFIESESSPPIFPASSNYPSIEHQAKYFTLQVLFFILVLKFETFFFIPLLVLYCWGCLYFFIGFLYVILCWL